MPILVSTADSVAWTPAWAVSIGAMRGVSVYSFRLCGLAHYTHVEDYESRLMPIILQIVTMDPFAALFTHVAPTAQTFFTGGLCQTLQFLRVIESRP